MAISTAKKLILLDAYQKEALSDFHNMNTFLTVAHRKMVLRREWERRKKQRIRRKTRIVMYCIMRKCFLNKYKGVMIKKLPQIIHKSKKMSVTFEQKPK